MCGAGGRRKGQGTFDRVLWCHVHTHALCMRLMHFAVCALCSRRLLPCLTLPPPPLLPLLLPPLILLQSQVLFPLFLPPLILLQSQVAVGELCDFPSHFSLFVHDFP